MENADDSVSIFRSASMDEFERAVELLQDSQIPFSIEYTREGSWKTPGHVHCLKVPGQFEEDARRAVADVPSEIILPGYTPTIATRNMRIDAWITVFVLVFIFVFVVIMTL